MTSLVVEQRKTGWDVLLGVLLVIAGFIVLGDTVLATVVSVLLLGWLTLVSGILALAAALFRIGRPGFWSAALSGGLLTVLGLMILRNVGVAALTLTLIAGALFLVSGVTRLVVAVENHAHRWVLLLGGLVSTALGLIVLFNIVAATYTLLGVLLGVQLLVDGLMIMLIGRAHVTAEPTPIDV
ncbi:MAG: HdeD family acid-resistance protein [Mycobacteriaceae bacterium]